jgi:hypothetical protein
MNYIERASVILTLAEELRAVGSWCGETHFQKTTYVLQDLCGVPLGFRFVLYKHGPYSFDLADLITEMRADQLVSIESRHPCGVTISPGPNAAIVASIAPEPGRRFQLAIQFVAKRLGPMRVAELEKIATARWVTRECPQCPQEECANHISELKPHISLEESRKAIADMEALCRDAALLLPA